MIDRLTWIEWHEPSAAEIAEQELETDYMLTSVVGFTWTDPIVTHATSVDNLHYLEVVDQGAQWDDEDRWEWELHHPSRCLFAHGCAENWLIDADGFDAFGRDVPQVEGRWPVEFVHEVIHGYDYATEHDIFIRWLEEPEP